MSLMGFRAKIWKFSSVVLIIISIAFCSSFTTQGLSNGSTDHKTVVFDSENNITQGLSAEERQWQSLLPNTPVPFAIERILHAGTKQADGRRGGTNKLSTESKYKSGIVNRDISVNKVKYDSGIVNGDISVNKVKYDSGIVNGDVSLNKVKYDVAAANTFIKNDVLADDVYFSYKDVKIGTTFSLKFPKITYPRFSSDEIDISSINKLHPTEAKAIKETIRVCKKKAAKSEKKKCVESLEEMLVFVTREIGTQVLAFSSEFLDSPIHHNYNVRRNYTVSGLKNITSSSTIVCHLIPYQKALFYCHGLAEIGVYQAALAGDNGTVLMSTIVICHMNTTSWSPNFIAFQQLNLKPGSSICHILLDTDVTWVSTI